MLVREPKKNLENTIEREANNMIFFVELIINIIALLVLLVHRFQNKYLTLFLFIVILFNIVIFSLLNYINIKHHVGEYE